MAKLRLIFSVMIVSFFSCVIVTASQEKLTNEIRIFLAQDKIIRQLQNEFYKIIHITLEKKSIYSPEFYVNTQVQRHSTFSYSQYKYVFPTKETSYELETDSTGLTPELTIGMRNKLTWGPIVESFGTLSLNQNQSQIARVGDATTLIEQNSNAYRYESNLTKRHYGVSVQWPIWGARSDAQSLELEVQNLQEKLITLTAVLAMENLLLDLASHTLLYWEALQEVMIAKEKKELSTTLLEETREMQKIGKKSSKDFELIELQDKTLTVDLISAELSFEIQKKWFDNRTGIFPGQSIDLATVNPSSFPLKQLLTQSGIRNVLFKTELNLSKILSQWSGLSKKEGLSVNASLEGVGYNQKSDHRNWSIWAQYNQELNMDRALHQGQRQSYEILSAESEYEKKTLDLTQSLDEMAGSYTAVSSQLNIAHQKLTILTAIADHTKQQYLSGLVPFQTYFQVKTEAVTQKKAVINLTIQFINSWLNYIKQSGLVLEGLRLTPKEIPGYAAY